MTQSDTDDDVNLSGFRYENDEYGERTAISLVLLAVPYKELRRIVGAVNKRLKILVLKLEM